MSKRILIIAGLILAIGIALLAARLISPEDTWICKDGAWVKHGNPSGLMPTGTCEEGKQISPQEVQKEISLPNPASQNCTEKGGKLEMLQETAGTLGICKFNDGTECEEWQFYRGECKKGQFTQAETFHPYRGLIRKGLISKMLTGYAFKDETGTEYTLKVPENASKELKTRMMSEVGSKEKVTIVASETPPLSKTLILKGFQEK